MWARGNLFITFSIVMPERLDPNTVNVLRTLLPRLPTTDPIYDSINMTEYYLQKTDHQSFHKNQDQHNQSNQGQQQQCVHQ